MKTLKQLHEQRLRYKRLWRSASYDTRKKAREVWKRKYAKVHELCDCGQYSSPYPGSWFPDYALHYAANVHGGSPWDYLDGFRLNKVASNIYNNLAIF